jgi:lipid-A-disaccharide synthase
MPKKILIIAGEASGDLHASHLLLELKKQYPDLYAFGLAAKSSSRRRRIMTDLTKLAVVGSSRFSKTTGNSAEYSMIS